MTDDRHNWRPLEVEIDEETYRFVEARGIRAGRTVSEQLAYELLLNRGMVPADPWDAVGRERARLMRRILEQRPLTG